MHFPSRPKLMKIIACIALNVYIQCTNMYIDTLLLYVFLLNGEAHICLMFVSCFGHTYMGNFLNSIYILHFVLKVILPVLNAQLLLKNETCWYISIWNIQGAGCIQAVR